MKISIKRYDTNKIIHEGDFNDIKECLEDGVRKKISFFNADLIDADLIDADLIGADLIDAYLTGADLTGADLRNTYLTRTNLIYADLIDVNLIYAKGLVKKMGVEKGNYYYKKINCDFKNINYYFRIGLNKLRKNEKFADDERILCSYPGFHFASKSWCELNYEDRKYLAKIQIPKNAKINEPWATDGKASADMIKIVQVWDEKGIDVTEELKKIKTDGKGTRKIKET